MKANQIFTTIILLIGFGTNVAFSRTAEEDTFKKCCKQLSKELRKSLAGPSFEELKPDCVEALVVRCYVDDNDKLKVYKVTGEDKKLEDYVITNINEAGIVVSNEEMKNKILRFTVSFEHRP